MKRRRSKAGAAWLAQRPARLARALGDPELGIPDAFGILIGVLVVTAEEAATFRRRLARLERRGRRPKGRRAS